MSARTYMMFVESARGLDVTLGCARVYSVTVEELDGKKYHWFVHFRPTEDQVYSYHYRTKAFMADVVKKHRLKNGGNDPFSMHVYINGEMVKVTIE